MSKFYCGIGHKWCKFCRKVKTKNKGKTTVCMYCKVGLSFLDKCPRIAEIETVRFYELVRSVDFDDAFSHIVKWWPTQKNCRDGYLGVYNKLCKMKPRWPKLGDMMISVDKEEWDGEIYPNVSGIYRNTNQKFGIEFTPWKDWISMYITTETITNFTHEEIVGACLWEMTYHGFDEISIQQNLTNLYDSIEEIKKN